MLTVQVASKDSISWEIYASLIVSSSQFRTKEFVQRNVQVVILIMEINYVKNVKMIV